MLYDWNGEEDIYLSVRFVGLNTIMPMCSKKDIRAEQLLTKVYIIHMEIKTSERAKSV